MNKSAHSQSVAIPKTPCWLTDFLAGIVFLLSLPFLIVPGLALALPENRTPVAPMIASVVIGLIATGLAWILWRGARGKQDFAWAAPALRRGLAIVLVLLGIPFLIGCLTGLASPDDRTANRLPLVFLSGFIAICVFSLARSIWRNRGVPLWIRRVVVIAMVLVAIFAFRSELLVFAQGEQLNWLVLLAVLGVAWFLRPAVAALWFPTPTHS